jgi:hypothetical protein
VTRNDKSRFKISVEDKIGSIHYQRSLGELNLFTARHDMRSSLLKVLPPFPFCFHFLHRLKS